MAGYLKRMAMMSVVSVSLVAGAPTAAGDATFAVTDTALEVERAMTFRERSGFRADQEFVQRSMTDPTFDEAAFGVPLSAAEVQEVQRRIDVQLAIDPAFALARSLPQSAGTYMDQQAGGIPVFLVAGDEGLFRDAIAAAIPSGVEYRVETAIFTLAQLNETQERIDKEFEVLQSAGIEARGTGRDIIANRVLVGVKGLTPAATRGLVERYGAIVATREEPSFQLDTSCLSRIDCPPLKGGIKIYLTSNTARICTAGWIVKLQGTSTLRALTAGHCIQLNGGIGAGWSHNGTQFGTARTETWGELSNADAGLISVSVPGPDNLFYASSQTDIRPVTGWVSNANQVVNSFLCRGGKTTGYRCGYIVTENVTRFVDGKNIEHQWEVDFDSSPGDSGAPMFLNYGAWGIATSSTDDDEPAPRLAWYSPMEWIFSKLSSYGEPITLCTSAVC